jgi:hypothetical protein
VCAAAACHRPRGRRRVTPVGIQYSRSLTLDRRSRACSGLRTRRYGGEADVASRGTMSCAGTPGSKTVPFCPVYNHFSPLFATKVHKHLNTKVAQHLTPYQSYKSSRVV